jgi:hypothetical protein
MGKKRSYLGLCVALVAITTAAQTNTFPTTGNVGIGTTSPGGGVLMSGGLTINGTGSTMLSIQNGGINALAINPSSQGSWTLFDNAAGQWTPSITSLRGNIGIGTLNPQAMLDVAGNVRIGGLVLNTLLPPDNADPIAHNYKIATIPTSGVGTDDHLHLLVTVNYSWAATANTYIDATFANRNGFAYQYTLRGSPVTSNARLTAYNNSDGSVDIYIGFGASAYSVAGFTVLENNQDTVYPSPVDVGATPSGTLVFDSSSSAYPASTYSDNLGNFSVAGNLTLKGASITFADGTVQSTAWKGSLCGGDYAESVDVSGDRSHYEPGDILVVDPNDSGHFLKSSEPYSTLVAGIYSTKPGLLGRRQSSDPKTSTTEVPMAMVGIVPTKVSAENGAIKRGDLLVTSSTLGYAMRGTDRSLLTGAIVGKALAPLESGTGVIEVLVSLQ